MKDDAQLIEETIAGDAAAFGDLVCRYQDRLFNTVVHVVGCPEEARDVVQDALVQAFVKLDTFRRSSAFYTWLYRIAFNVAATNRRRRKPAVSLERIKGEAGSEPRDNHEAPEHRVLLEERASQVQAALAVLSREHREVLVLRDVEGCCYDTIADVLDVPVGTVRSRLHRARIQLRDQLRDVLQEEHR